MFFSYEFPKLSVRVDVMTLGPFCIVHVYRATLSTHPTFVHL